MILFAVLHEAYRGRVCETLIPLVDSETASWLKGATRWPES